MCLPCEQKERYQNPFPHAFIGEQQRPYLVLAIRYCSKYAEGEPFLVPFFVDSGAEKVRLHPDVIQRLRPPNMPKGRDFTDAKGEIPIFLYIPVQQEAQPQDATAAAASYAAAAAAPSAAAEESSCIKLKTSAIQAPASQLDPRFGGFSLLGTSALHRLGLYINFVSCRIELHGRPESVVYLPSPSPSPSPPLVDTLADAALQSDKK